MYETKLKKALGNEWQRVDLRRTAMRKYTEWYHQKVQGQVVLDHQKQGGSTLRELGKAVKELNKVVQFIPTLLWL